MTMYVIETKRNGKWSPLGANELGSNVFNSEQAAWTRARLVQAWYHLPETDVRVIDQSKSAGPFYP
jgi:hypothetical protein